MPAKSEAQRRWAFGVKGPAWARAHHFDTKGSLPPRVINRAIAARKKKRVRKK
jgi:hypothetical protein